MKLKNKKTGEIGELSVWRRADNDELTGFAVIKENEEFPTDYKNLAELNAEWEDYEEPKEWYYIDISGVVKQGKDNVPTHLIEGMGQIGNYFETEEEAEKAVEKLKAWKRMKDGGITFKNWTINQTGTIDCFATWGDNIPPSRKDPTLQEDLDLLFGGENE